MPAITPAGIFCGLLAMGFGLFAPPFIQTMPGMPASFIATLAGLAMIHVLQTAFLSAFSGRCSLGALITFVVTVTDITVANLGAAFWGLLAGVATSWALERKEFRSAPK